MKRIITLLLACLMIVGLFAGCGNNADTGSNATAETTAAVESTPEKVTDAVKTEVTEKVDLRIVSAATAGSTAYEQIAALSKQMMSENSNININFEGLASAELRTKLSVEFAAGTPPDAGWIPVSYAREYMKTGQILDWAPIIAKDAELKGYFSDDIWNNVTTADGKILICPAELSFDSLYYNAEMFKENGWKAPTTWDELIALCDTINASGKGIYPLATGGSESRFAWLASALLSRAGGLDNFKELTIGNALDQWNNPDYGFVAAMEKFKELVDHKAYYPGTMGMTAAEADEAFARGEVAMYYEGAWKVGNFISAGGAEFVDKLDRVNFPAMTDRPDGDPKNNVGGAIIGYYAASGLSPAKEEVAIAIIKGIASPAFNVKLVENGGYLYCGETNYDKTKVSSLMLKCLEASKQATSFIPSMDAIAAPAIDLAIKGTAMPGLLTGEYTVDQAVAEVQKAAEDYAASLKK